MKKTIHSTEYRNVVEKLKKARKESGLTQKEVAEKLKKPQSYVSKAEAGEQRLDIIELKSFAKTYSKNINYFI